jgi:hypothetical protein
MTEHSIAAPDTNAHWRAGAAALAVLLMTTIHHVYGAIIYDTPFRLHIVFISLPVAMAFTFALYVGALRPGTAAGRAATLTGAAIILVFAVAAIGFFEGGYNHVVKNVVYFVGGEDAMMKLVPEWLYDPAAVETPNDLLFELTGIAQFPLAVWAAVLTMRLLRRRLG